VAAARRGGPGAAPAASAPAAATTASWTTAPTPAITASRNAARASGRHDLVELRGQRGHGKPGMDAGRPRHARLQPAPHLHGRRRNPPGHRAAREQGAARCQAPALRPRPWPSRRVNYRTMLNPACSPERRFRAACHGPLGRDQAPQNCLLICTVSTLKHRSLLQTD
jgi:hypothetical protein